MRARLPWIAAGLVVVASFAWFPWGGSATPRVDARRLVAEGAALIDVRSPSEFAGGHIDGATNVPVDQVAARASEIGPRDRTVVVYCRSGARSAAAARTLRDLGFERVEDLGAMSNW